MILDLVDSMRPGLVLRGPPRSCGLGRGWSRPLKTGARATVGELNTAHQVGARFYLWPKRGILAAADGLYIWATTVRGLAPKTCPKLNRDRNRLAYVLGRLHSAIVGHQTCERLRGAHSDKITQAPSSPRGAPNAWTLRVRVNVIGVRIRAIDVRSPHDIECPVTSTAAGGGATSLADVATASRAHLDSAGEAQRSVCGLALNRFQ